MSTATLPFIEISGEPRERGRQYGEAAREQIRRSMAFYRDAYSRAAKLSWDEVLERAPRWVPLIDDYLPGITDEVHGIAEGAGVTFADILALNGRGELSAGNPFEEQKDDGCSSFAILQEAAGDGHVYCGQNWDWRSAIADTVVVLRIAQPGKPTIIMHAEAGQVGRQGANSAGIGLNANGLGTKFGKRMGVPGTYIRRKILDSPDMHDALDAVFSAQQTFCTNLLLTHREGFAIDIETTPARHGWMYPTDGLLVHANHFIAFIPPQVADTYRPFSPDSLYRVPRIERVLKQARTASTSEQMRELIATAMRDHFGKPNSVCNHPDPRNDRLVQNQTIASSIVDLTAGEYYVAAGLPCTSEYIKAPWSLYADADGDLETAKLVNGHSAIDGRSLSAEPVA
jgi:isopenicillin-N N-acyltransferase-like protein